MIVCVNLETIHNGALGAGSDLLMSPLILHALSPSLHVKEQRRVLHFEFAEALLAPPLRYNLQP